MTRKKILIIGGTGFVGEYLTRELKEEEKKLTLVFHASDKGRDNLVRDIHYFQTDLTTKDERRQELTEDLEQVIILSQPNQILSQNICQLLDSAQNLKRIIYVSSILLYPSSFESQGEEIAPLPESEYEMGKHFEEKLFSRYSQERKIKLCLARLSNVYGDIKNKGIIGKIFESALSGTALQMNGGGKIIRDYIFVDDVAALLYILLSNYEQENPEEIFNVSTGKGYSLLELVKEAEVVINNKLNVSYRPEITGKRSIIGDNRKISAVFPSFKPTDLKAGLQKSYERYLSKSLKIT